ncbi:hypothetical protein V6N13_020630 [Hibiscus sabdariffa]
MIEEIGLSSENPTLQSNEKDDDEGQENKNLGSRISAYAAYQIAASAASYLHSHTMTILPFKSSNPKNNKVS